LINPANLYIRVCSTLSSGTGYRSESTVWSLDLDRSRIPLAIYILISISSLPLAPCYATQLPPVSVAFYLSEPAAEAGQNLNRRMASLFRSRHPRLPEGRLGPKKLQQTVLNCSAAQRCVASDSLSAEEEVTPRPYGRYGGQEASLTCFVDSAMIWRRDGPRSHVRTGSLMATTSYHLQPRPNKLYDPNMTFFRENCSWGGRSSPCRELVWKLFVRAQRPQGSTESAHHAMQRWYPWWYPETAGSVPNTDLREYLTESVISENSCTRRRSITENKAKRLQSKASRQANNETLMTRWKKRWSSRRIPRSRFLLRQAETTEEEWQTRCWGGSARICCWRDVNRSLQRTPIVLPSLRHQR
jgi:hypothetical protein